MNEIDGSFYHIFSAKKTDRMNSMAFYTNSIFHEHNINMTFEKFKDATDEPKWMKEMKKN